MPLRILVVHNYYQQPGGEDVVVRLESELLRARGHEVIKYERHNDELNGLGRASSTRSRSLPQYVPAGLTVCVLGRLPVRPARHSDASQFSALVPKGKLPP
jgi:hypothetical protein